MTPLFNIRVYGLLLHEKKVLLSDETYQGKAFTKFPGGGLEKNEGLLDALKRELCEELHIETSEFVHFYTTDFFQASAFNPEEQLISMYYQVTKFDLAKINARIAMHIPGERFRWAEIATLTEADLTFPIDKKVALLLKAAT